MKSWPCRPSRVPPHEKDECWADIRTLIKPLPGIRVVLLCLLIITVRTIKYWRPVIPKKSNTQNVSFSDSKISTNQNRRLLRKSNTNPTLERTEGQLLFGPWICRRNVLVSIFAYFNNLIEPTVHFWKGLVKFLNLSCEWPTCSWACLWTHDFPGVILGEILCQWQILFLKMPT